MTTQPADEATTDLAAVLAAVESAWADHDRTNCNAFNGGDLARCACVCGEVLRRCTPGIQAEHRREKVAEALAPYVRQQRAAALDEARSEHHALCGGGLRAAIAYEQHLTARAEAERRGAPA